MHIFVPNFATLHPFTDHSVRQVRRKQQKHHNTITLQSSDHTQECIIKDRRRSLTTANNPRKNTSALVGNAELIDWVAELSLNSKRNETKISQNNSYLKLRVRKAKSSNYESIAISSSPLKLIRDGMLTTKRPQHPAPFFLAKKIEYQMKSIQKPRLADIRTLAASGTKVFYRKGNMTPILCQQNSQYRPWSPTKRQYEQYWDN